MYLGSSQWSIVAGGHADKTGSPQGNLRLSRDRAKAVFDYLVSTGLPREKIRFAWRGDTQPLVQVQGPEAQNRRVEIFISTPGQSHLRDYKEC